MHEFRDRHVAIDAVASRRSSFVKAVIRLEDLGRRRDRRLVAAETKRISSQEPLAGVGIVTIDTVHPGRMHFTAEERSELEIFIPHLAVREEEIALVRNGKSEMVGILLARDKVAGDFAPS